MFMLCMVGRSGDVSEVDTGFISDCLVISSGIQEELLSNSKSGHSANSRSGRSLASDRHVMSCHVMSCCVH